ncbi:MAG: type II toxin-antitoxin system HicA family toxin [Nitrospirota bacterium]
MPKIPSLTAEQVVRLLLQNGFELDHQTGSHRVYYNKTTKKRVTVPYHKRELPRGTVLSILKQAGLK